MERISIKNFWPIEEAVLDIKPLLVLIGQQASGKSTAAKLVYFFKTLWNDIHVWYCSGEETQIGLLDIKRIIKAKFQKSFGLPSCSQAFRIQYTYATGRTVTLCADARNKLTVSLSADFLTLAVKRQLRKNKLSLTGVNIELDRLVEAEDSTKEYLRRQQIMQTVMIMQDIKRIFGIRQDDELYVLAGRNATVGYGETFERFLMYDLQKRIEEQGAHTSPSEQTMDEMLMSAFMNRVLKIRQTLQRRGNVEGIVAGTDAPELKLKLQQAAALMAQVLHAEYVQTENGEMLKFKGGAVYLKHASSGQQEAVRILQDAFLAMSQDRTTLRVVEEPEAHLFPEAQKYTIQILIEALNAKADNQLIITTHSPYTLTVLNNLLYASRLADTYPSLAGDIRRILPENFWLRSDALAAYQLKGGRAEDIIDREVMMVKAEKIDSVSVELNKEYDELGRLEYEMEKLTADE